MDFRGDFFQEVTEIVYSSTPASLSSLPPPRIPEDFPLLLGSEDQWGLASSHGHWCQEARALAREWWLSDARYALLALARAGVNLQAVASRLRSVLLPPDGPVRAVASSEGLCCPFPDADVHESVWDQLCDMCHASACVPSARGVHRRLAQQVLSVPRLAYWVREGRASQVAGFLLSSQWDFLVRRPPHEPFRPPPLVPKAPLADDPPEAAPKASAAVYDEWLSVRAPAVLTAHLLLRGQRKEALVTMGLGSTDDIDHLIIEEMMAEDIQNVPAAACMQEMDLLNRSWQAFAASRADRAACKRLALQARRASQSERSHQKRQRLPPPLPTRPSVSRTKGRLCRRNQ